MGNHEEVQHQRQSICGIKHLYDKATSAVLFNIFLERIMTDALEDHEGTVSNRGRTITNLRFAGDIDGLAGEEENWQI